MSPAHRHSGTQSNENAGRIRGIVGLAQIAAHRRGMSYADVADFPECLSQDQLLLTNDRRCFGFTNGGEGANSKTDARLVPNTAQFLQCGETQQGRRRDQAILQHNDQRRTARDDLRFIAFGGKMRQGLIKRSWFEEFYIGHLVSRSSAVRSTLRTYRVYFFYSECLCFSSA